MVEHPSGDADAASKDAAVPEGAGAHDTAPAAASPPKATRRLTRVSAKNRVRLLARAVYLRVAREEAWQLQRDRTESLGLRAAVAGLETELDELAARTGTRRYTELGGTAATQRLAAFYAQWGGELRGGEAERRTAAEQLLTSIDETPESVAPWLDVEWDKPLEHLAALDSDSLGAVTVRNLLELADVDSALELLTSVRRALRNDGLLVIESIDPAHPDALSRMAREPRLRRLWHPDLLSVLVRHCGFDDGRVVSDSGRPDYVFTARAGH